MDKKGHQGMSNMAGMLLVSSKIHVGEQQRGRRSKWDEGVTHESSAPAMMARREAPSYYIRDICFKNEYFLKVQF